VIRILHTESSMNLGGQELRTLLEMEGLSRHGFSSLLIARPGSGIGQESKQRGLQVFEVPMRGSVDPVAVARCAGIMRNQAVHLVCTHGSKDGWSAGVAARLLGRPIVRSRNVANPIRSHLWGRLVYTALSDLIITTSQFIKAGMIARGIPETKILCVPTGVDPSRFHPDVEKGCFRKELGITGERPLVGMVSVLRGDKGPDIFLCAAEDVLKERPEVFFVLVGDGWMRTRLESMVQGSPYFGSMKLTGFRRDIPQVLADLDLLVLPARIPEGVPQTILQAHAMKVPVIASNVGGINEVALDQETAVLVPPGDARALAQSIVAVLGDPHGAGRRAENGRGMFLKAYTEDMFLHKMAAIYRSLLEHRGRNTLTTG
jgi:glycosyltransferase involved in cell wall biosynthesis